MILNRRIPVYYIAQKIKYQIVYVVVVLLLVMLLTKLYDPLLPKMPLTIPTFIGTAISILLSFKLNQSYDRWWEARKVWGAIVNDSRTFVIQLQSFVKPGNESSVRRMAFRQIAWCYTLGQSLRGLDPLQGLNEHLDDQDMKEISLHQNKALALASLNAHLLKELRGAEQIGVFEQVQIDDTLVRLVDSQGKAERIKSTVFPMTYRLFLHFMIYLFVVTLSISLRNVAALYEIPLLLVISSIFFLLERSATHMQDPFENRPTDTAMTAIARTIEINIKQLLKEEQVPPPLESKTFYLP